MSSGTLSFWLRCQDYLVVVTLGDVHHLHYLTYRNRFVRVDAESGVFLVLEEAHQVVYDQCVLLAKLLAFALLHSVLQGQTCLYSWYFLTSYFHP